MERAWSRAVELAPDNAAAWSNRGTARLQAGRWRAAYDDLAHALELEAAQCGGARVSDGVSALLLNQLGNAEGALGRWGDAMAHYREAAEDPQLESIAGEAGRVMGE
jgi:tetratricopeptide (TPR) repeat protein